MLTTRCLLAGTILHIRSCTSACLQACGSAGVEACVQSRRAIDPGRQGLTESEEGLQNQQAGHCAEEAGAHKLGGGQVVALLALGRGVLAEVVILLGGARLGAAEESTPHGEVDRGDAEHGDGADDAAHPLEGVIGRQHCSRPA